MSSDQGARVVGLVDGIQAVAELSDCYVLGFCMRGLNRMQLSYCVGSVAAFVSCKKGRHVEGTPLLRWSTVPMCRKFVGRQAFVEADHP